MAKGVVDYVAEQDQETVGIQQTTHRLDMRVEAQLQPVGLAPEFGQLGRRQSERSTGPRTSARCCCGSSRDNAITCATSRVEQSTLTPNAAMNSLRSSSVRASAASAAGAKMSTLLAESAQIDALAAHARLLLDAHQLWSAD